MFSNQIESEDEGEVVRHLTIAPLAQSKDYDCGLACASMIIAGVCECLGSASTLWSPEVVYHYYDNMSAGNRSIWTIDLFSLMKTVFAELNLSVRVKFTTTMLGCNPEHATNAFYVMDYCADEQRVAYLFQSCIEKGYDVQKKSYDTEALILFLSKPNTAMIVLVDSCYFLDRYLASYHMLPTVSTFPTFGWLTSCFGCPISSNDVDDNHRFQGHYVVATGYNAAAGTVCINNPSSSTPEEIPLDVFEKGRTAFGTDNDIVSILI